MWGEIVNFSCDSKTSINLSSVIDQSREKNCLSMYEIPLRINEALEIALPSIESRTLYAGELHKRTANMTKVIAEAELAVKYNLIMQEEMPPITTPEAPDIHCGVQRNPLNFYSKKYSSFSMGFGKNPPIISEISRRQIERKVIATILAHIGFLSTNKSVLELLIDIFESFMSKVCNEIRCAKDSGLTDDHAGFADIIERILFQNGLGGVQGICDYYDKRVIKYEKVLKDRYGNVSSYYEKMLAPTNIQIECKTEKNDEVDSQDVPEVHFTAMDGEEGYLQPFLESGFQMLNSLEEGQLT